MSCLAVYLEFLTWGHVVEIVIHELSCCVFRILNLGTCGRDCDL